MVQHFDITEDFLKTKEFEAEAIYFCMDTGNVYVDSIEEGIRKRIASDVIFISEESRSALLAPLPNKLYCIPETGRIYVYNSEGWFQIGRFPFEVPDIIVENGTATITDVRISSISNAKFIPDLSVVDLVTSNVVTCANGSATITLNSEYPIPGRLIVS